MAGLSNNDVVVLTYHSNNVLGNSYAENDHFALRDDLHHIGQAGINIISLQQLVDALLDYQFSQLPHPCVAITFDDGSWFDWHDLPHPEFRIQISFANILRKFIKNNPRYTSDHPLASSFVIASPQARNCLDNNCLIGKGWLSDDWWSQAQQEGIIGIHNHSWDHKHPGIDPELCYGTQYGSFRSLETTAECHWQIQQAQHYLHELLGNDAAEFLAYPYGDCPDI